ncbi:MAG TPA: hypothetical protein VHY34_02875, partial [Caulobacteraceae bacterium]|nr:hypothetical protein [Caulobacteraceae bacterium]
SIGENQRVSKLYNAAQFPGFWGRLVHLATQCDVTFYHPLFTAPLNSEFAFSLASAKTMLTAVLSAKAGTFGMDISAPLPDAV